jgi:hypothetical protein
MMAVDFPLPSGLLVRSVDAKREDLPGRSSSIRREA